MTNTNEYELVRRLLLSEVAAFDTLYHKYHNSLYFNILRLTKDSESARDILQDVFVTLWKKRTTLDPDQSILSWLFVVSYNKAIDYLKHTQAEFAIAQQSRIIAPSSAGEAELKEAQLQLLEEAIQQLSPQKRKVFVLCKLQGKSYEETAEELHISKHTVKEYLSGAVTYIKGYVQQHPDYYTGCLIFFLLTL